MLRLSGCASKTLIIVPGTAQRQRLTEDRDFVSLSTGVSGLTWPRILTVEEPLLQGFLNVMSGDLLEQDGEVPLPRRTRALGPDP
jgi:hypothetical protein